ncbi:hypothetical protein ACLB2K_077385 [Fragaria x ananassa]
MRAEVHDCEADPGVDVEAEEVVVDEGEGEEEKRRKRKRRKRKRRELLEAVRPGTMPMTWRRVERWSPVTLVAEFMDWRRRRRIPGVGDVF